MIALIIALLIIIPLIFAAICNSIMDTLKDHFDASIFSNLENKLFWDPRLSWRNKWNDKGEEKFIGSSTVFVWTTDAWHFFQFLMLTFIQASITLPLWYLLDMDWYYIIILVIGLKVIWGVPFELFYKYIWKK